MLQEMEPEAMVRSGGSFARRHPRVVLALKAACAAGLAWLLVQPLGGFADDYPYYAPLGATVAMSTSVKSSLRTALQTVAAIVLGACVALVARVLPLPDEATVAVAIGLVIAVGTLLAGWPLLGAMGGWVPIAGLFVLILGGSHPAVFVLAYAGLTAVGALVGVAVNAALPQLPLTPAAQAQQRLRHELARQLDQLALDLESEELVVSEEQRDRVWSALDPQLRDMHDLLSTALEARHGNWRARRRRQQKAERHHRHARALQQLVGTVEEVVALVADGRSPVHGDDDGAAELRRRVAHALVRIAEMLRTDDDERSDLERRAAYEQAAIAVRQLKREVSRIGCRPTVQADGRDLTAAAIAVGLDRAVDTWR